MNESVNDMRGDIKRIDRKLDKWDKLDKLDEISQTLKDIKDNL
jgi:hypothetical protein